MIVPPEFKPAVYVPNAAANGHRGTVERAQQGCPHACASLIGLGQELPYRHAICGGYLLITSGVVERNVVFLRMNVRKEDEELLKAFVLRHCAVAARFVLMHPQRFAAVAGAPALSAALPWS